MKQKRFFHGLSAALAVLILAGCASQAGAPGDNQAGTSADRTSLVLSVGGMTDGSYDPCTGYGGYGYGIFHTALLKIDNDVFIRPDLATEYTVGGDGLTYTFTLRDDVLFSDGEPLTPQDVVFTFETAKSSGSVVDLTMLEEVRARGQEITFTLNRVYAPFVRTVALQGIVPAHAYGDGYAENPVGTGPFRVRQLDVGQQLIVEPNEYYYGTQSPFRQITFLNIDEEAALANAMSGQLDVVMVNPEYAHETVPGMHLVTLSTSDNRGFNLPVIPETVNAAGETVGNTVTADPAVRQALNIGISRREIIDNALDGVGTPSWVRFEGLPWANLEPGLTDGRVDEAVALLEEAGWVDEDGDGVREKDGVRCAFTITGRTDDLQRYNLAVALSENARSLGIEIDAQAVDWNTCKDLARTSPTCIGTGDYSYIDVYNAFHSSFGIDETGLNNTALYQNDTVDAYLDAMLAATSEEEALELARLAQFDGETGPNVDLPYLWLVNIDHTYFVRDGLSLGEQRIHPHGHGEPVIQNLEEWAFVD